MNDFRFVLSNTKIILSDDETDLENLKDSINFVFDVFMSNNEMQDIKIYLVDNVEDAEIFATIIQPLVEHYLELVGPNQYSALRPYVSLYIETTKTNYTLAQLEYLKNNGIFFMQTVSSVPTEEYLASMAQTYPAANIKFVINQDNVGNLFEIMSVFLGGGFYNITFDIDWENYSTPDFCIIEEQLNLYRDYIINAFESYTVPPIALRIENALCKVLIAYYEQQNDTYRTSMISTFSCREGVGGLGDYIIKNGGIYLNKYCLNDGVFKVGQVYGSLDVTAISSIQSTESYNCDMCDKCYCNRICNNGNPGINYLLTQSYNTMDSAYCQWENLLLSVAYNIIQYFDKEQSNELFKSYMTGLAQRGVRIEY